MSSSVHDTRVQAAKDRLAEALRTGAPTGAYRAAIANLDASAAAAAQRDADKRAADLAAAKAAAEFEIDERAAQIASEARARIEVSIDRFQYRPATQAATSEAAAAAVASNETGDWEAATLAATLTAHLCDDTTVLPEATTIEGIDPGPVADAPTGATDQAGAELNTNTLTKETDHV